MSEAKIIIDPALLNDFIDESIESLESLDNLFVQLEQTPNELSIVEAIFRPVHSVKGNSAFFGMSKVKILAHELETLLDLVRKNSLSVTKNLTDVLLKGIDQLKIMLTHVRNSEDEVDDIAKFDTLVENVKAAASNPAGSSEATWRTIFTEIDKLDTDFSDKADGLANKIIAIKTLLSAVCPIPLDSNTEQIDVMAAWKAAPQPALDIKAILEMPIDDTLDESSAQNVFKALQDIESLVITDAGKNTISEAIESYHTFMDTVGFDSLVAEIILEKIELLVSSNALNTNTDNNTDDSEPQSDQAQNTQTDKYRQSDQTDNLAKKEIAKKKQTAESNKTMRISEAHIDTFLEYVGELLVIGDMFENLQQRLVTNDSNITILSDFRRANDTFGILSGNLQKSIMSIRKVPVRILLQKVPRMVRDIAANNGKSISADVIGGDIEIDKSLIDVIDAPLTHMVRNAADHGIEMPDIREANGKSAKGSIQVKVSETDDFIVLSITDDGAGINYEAISAKAESLGLISAGQKVTEQDIVDLLFYSGVSTAAQVTDVSGRGVGMDVVKRYIEGAGGNISITSNANQGSVFTVNVPKSVTTQIMDGYIVSVAGSKYVLPMNKVRETASMQEIGINTVVGKGQCVVRHEKILPIISLQKTLGFDNLANKNNNHHLSEKIMVTIDSNRKKIALVVDDVLGVQQVVLRQIEGVDNYSELITGGALMGDGGVALILNTDKLHNTAA